MANGPVSEGQSPLGHILSLFHELSGQFPKLTLTSFPDACFMPLGMQDGRISRSHLTASSMWNNVYGPWSGRLQARNHGAKRGAWISRPNNRNQWIKVDLQTLSRLKGIATQGRYDAGQWVKSYTVSFSRDGRRFFPYREGKRVRVCAVKDS